MGKMRVLQKVKRLSSFILHTIYLKKLVALIWLAEVYVTLQQDKPK